MVRGEYVWRIVVYYVLTHRQLPRTVRRLYTNTAVTWVLRALLLAEIVLMIVTAFIMQRLVEFSDACLIVQTTRVVEAFG